MLPGLKEFHWVFFLLVQEVTGKNTETEKKIGAKISDDPLRCTCNDFYDTFFWLLSKASMVTSPSCCHTVLGPLGLLGAVTPSQNCIIVIQTTIYSLLCHMLVLLLICTTRGADSCTRMFLLRFYMEQRKFPDEIRERPK